MLEELHNRTNETNQQKSSFNAANRRKYRGDILICKTHEVERRVRSPLLAFPDHQRSPNLLKNNADQS
jgi:hypothetical protein